MAVEDSSPSQPFDEFVPFLKGTNSPNGCGGLESLPVGCGGLKWLWRT